MKCFPSKCFKDANNKHPISIFDFRKKIFIKKMPGTNEIIILISLFIQQIGSKKEYFTDSLVFGVLVVPTPYFPASDTLDRGWQPRGIYKTMAISLSTYVNAMRSSYRELMLHVRCIDKAGEFKISWEIITTDVVNFLTRQ
ncbi:unnamed protein product [Owenia fusiformis]|uniref:Uncharacterized protein n=1 Tax=Owenia fusiformis TaxID=6347 RepID=A0A8J1UH64_OWEFU|nr:unnamed protein product [Owenia fusiformis]